MFGKPKYSVLVVAGCFPTEIELLQDLALALNLPDMEVVTGQCCVVFKDKPHGEFMVDICDKRGWNWKELVPIGKWERHEAALLIHKPFWMVKQALEEKGCGMETSE